MPKPRLLLILALALPAAAILLRAAFLGTPMASPDFPPEIAERIERLDGVYISDIDPSVRLFCFVGGYETVEDSLRQRGIQSDIDLYVYESDFALVLLGHDDSVRYRYFAFDGQSVSLRASACYPAAHNRLVIQRNRWDPTDLTHYVTVERVEETAASSP